MRHVEESYDKSVAKPIDLAYLFGYSDDVGPPVMDDLDPTQPIGATRRPNLELATKVKVDYRGHLAKSSRLAVSIGSFEETEEDLDESWLKDNSDDNGGSNDDDGDNMVGYTAYKDSTPPWVDEDTGVEGTNLADARDEYEVLHLPSGQVYTRHGAGSGGAQEQTSLASRHGHYPSIDDLSSLMGGMHMPNQWYGSSSGYDYDSSYGYGHEYHQEADSYHNEATSWLA